MSQQFLPSRSTLLPTLSSFNCCHLDLPASPLEAAYEKLLAPRYKAFLTSKNKKELRRYIAKIAASVAYQLGYSECT